MGALHEGHLSLVKQSLDACNHTVVSIFVNPKQFAPNEDFDSYPRDLNIDQSALESLGVDVLFLPDETIIYPDNFSTYVAKKDTPVINFGKINFHKINQFWECKKSRSTSRQKEKL